MLTETRVALPALVLSLATLTACVGALDDDGVSGPPRHGGPINPDQPAADDTTPAPVRRLANEELANALETLTGGPIAVTSMLPGDVSDARTLLFPGIAGRQGLVPVDTWLSIADDAARGTSTTRIAELAPSCAAAHDRACATSFARALGHAAFRRPLAADEEMAMLALYDGAGDPDEGLRQIIRFVVLSPSFLYVIERGTVAARPELIALSDGEIATRLALALTNDLPDAQLLAAAEAGALHTPEQIRAQAERLFTTDRARHAVERFFDYWLGLDDVAHLTRDAAAYPQLDASLNASMLAETHTFLAHEVWDAGANLPDLFRADFSFVDARLGALYGLDVTGNTPTRVQLPAERRGLLTQAAILAHDQGSVYTRPIQRSVYVLRRLLCTDLPPPPPTVDASPRANEAGATTRQTYEHLTAPASCSGCHQSLINPVGFALEDFDAIGAHRTTERGQPVDASGGIPSLSVSGVTGGAAMSMAVAGSDELHVCFARQWLRYTLGRRESQADATSLRVITDASRSGASLRQVMLSVVTTFAFTHRVLPPG